MRIGESLMSMGLIKRDQLVAGLRQQAKTKRLLGETLLDLGYLSEAGLLKVLATRFNTSYLTGDRLHSMNIPAELLELVPRELCERHVFFPIMQEDEVTLGMVGCEPQNIKGIREIRNSARMNVKVYLARREVVQSMIHKHYQATTAGSFDIDVELGAVSDEDYLEMLRALVSEIEMVTGRVDHAEKVAITSRLIAEQLKCTPREIRNIRVAAYLHDVGKYTLPHMTLISIATNGRLEYLSKQCGRSGLDLMEESSLSQEVQQILAHMYDSFVISNSSKTPVGAHIIAAVDAYADLATNPENPFRKTCTPRQCLKVMTKWEHLFEPQVLKHLFNVIESREIQTLTNLTRAPCPWREQNATMKVRRAG